MNEAAGSEPVEETRAQRGWKLQFGTLCAMLGMAMIGMALNQAEDERAWQYWTLVVFAYAALGIWRSTQRARRSGRPIGSMVSREVGHWLLLLVFMAILLLLEHKALIDRESAADFSLLLLAFSCCQAGMHFDWLLLVLGAALTIMVVAVATMEQYSSTLWGVMTVVVLIAAGLFYWKVKHGSRSAGSP